MSLSFNGYLYEGWYDQYLMSVNSTANYRNFVFCDTCGTNSYDLPISDYYYKTNTGNRCDTIFQHANPSVLTFTNSFSDKSTFTLYNVSNNGNTQKLKTLQGEVNGTNAIIKLDDGSFYIIAKTPVINVYEYVKLFNGITDSTFYPSNKLNQLLIYRLDPQANVLWQESIQDIDYSINSSFPSNYYYASFANNYLVIVTNKELFVLDKDASLISRSKNMLGHCNEFYRSACFSENGIIITGNYFDVPAYLTHSFKCSVNLSGQVNWVVDEPNASGPYYFDNVKSAPGGYYSFEYINNAEKKIIRYDNTSVSLWQFPKEQFSSKNIRGYTPTCNGGVIISYSEGDSAYLIKLDKNGN